jgi:hypothetical protein
MKRGRKPNRAVLSGIPKEETWDEIRCRIIFGSNEWPMVGLRQLIATGQRQKIEPLMRKLIADCERAALDGDADWFRRQANAIKKGGSPQRAQFYEKIVDLLEYAMCKTLGRPVNWRLLTNAERTYAKRQGFPNLRRVPQVITLTPAGNFTDKTARNIYNALDKHSVWAKKGRSEVEHIIAEGYQFENKERIIEAIQDFAKRLQFGLKKQARC